MTVYGMIFKFLILEWYANLWNYKLWSEKIPENQINICTKFLLCIAKKFCIKEIPVMQFGKQFLSNVNFEEIICFLHGSYVLGRCGVVEWELENSWNNFPPISMVELRDFKRGHPDVKKSTHFIKHSLSACENCP